MNSDWSRYAEWRAQDGATPLEIVRELALPKILGQLGYFVFGFIIAQPILILLYFRSLGQIPSFQKYGWGISFILSLFGVGVLSTQLILTYDLAHHTVFKSTKWRPVMQFSLVSLAFTLAAFPLLQFVPFSEVEYGLNNPAYELYSKISMFTVTLAMPYLSKVFFDWFPFKKSVVRRLPIAMASIMVVLLLIVTGVGISLSIFKPSVLQIAKYSLYTALLGAGLTIGLTRGMAKYRDGREYSSDADSIGNSSSTFERISKSKRISIIAGIHAGLGIPLVAGINHATSIGIELDHLNIIILLLVGYFNLFLTIVLWVITFIVLGGLLSLFLLITIYFLEN